MDRIDLRIDVPAVTARDLSDPAPRETSADVAARVVQARERQNARYTTMASSDGPAALLNARAEQGAIEKHVALDQGALALLSQVADTANLSARGYFRVLRVARTIADLGGSHGVERPHLAEALTYRGMDAAALMAA